MLGQYNLIQFLLLIAIIPLLPHNLSSSPSLIYSTSKTLTTTATATMLSHKPMDPLVFANHQPTTPSGAASSLHRIHLTTASGKTIKTSPVAGMFLFIAIAQAMFETNLLLASPTPPASAKPRAVNPERSFSEGYFQTEPTSHTKSSQPQPSALVRIFIFLFPLFLGTHI